MPGQPKKRKAGQNSTTQTAVVIAALTALQDGDAKTKKEAAAQAGTSVSALTPASLARVAKNPLFRAFLKTHALDISSEITRADGSKARVSMREALSQGATRCVAKMADLQAKVGDWTPLERETFRQCEKWLMCCKAMGLFRDADSTPLPADLANNQEPQTGGEWWMQDTTRHEQPPGLLTVLPREGEIPSQAQPVTTAGNVQA